MDAIATRVCDCDGNESDDSNDGQDDDDFASRNLTQLAGLISGFIGQPVAIALPIGVGCPGFRRRHRNFFGWKCPYRGDLARLDHFSAHGDGSRLPLQGGYSGVMFIQPRIDPLYDAGSADVVEDSRNQFGGRVGRFGHIANRRDGVAEHRVGRGETLQQFVEFIVADLDMAERFVRKSLVQFKAPITSY